MDEMGVKPSGHQVLEDVRKLPFTDKHVRCARRSRMACSPCLWTRWWSFIRLRAPQESPSWWAITATTWTFGTIASCDWCRWRASCLPIACRWRSGYGMFTGGFGLHYGLQRLGCMMIPAGSGNTERQIQMIQDYGTTVLVATLSNAMHICEVGEKMGYDWETSTLRVGLFGGEAVPSGSQGRNRSVCISFARTNYGLTEVMGPGVSGECPG